MSHRFIFCRSTNWFAAAIYEIWTWQATLPLLNCLLFLSVQKLNATSVWKFSGFTQTEENDCLVHLYLENRITIQIYSWTWHTYFRLPRAECDDLYLLSLSSFYYSIFTSSFYFMQLLPAFMFYHYILLLIILWVLPVQINVSRVLPHCPIWYLTDKISNRTAVYIVPLLLLKDKVNSELLRTV